jgi:CheY-like chemotaxis protein
MVVGELGSPRVSPVRVAEKLKHGVKMKRFLFLDDQPERHKRFNEICAPLNVRVRGAWSAEDAIRALSSCEVFDCVWLDHDLGDYGNYLYEPSTGLVVAQFIALHLPIEKLPRNVIIHSWNPSGARAMERTLRENGYLNVKRVEFSFR